MSDVIDNFLIKLDYELERYFDLFDHARGYAASNGTLDPPIQDILIKSIFKVAQKYINTNDMFRSYEKKHKGELKQHIHRAIIKNQNEFVEFYRSIHKIITTVMMPTSKDALSSIRYRWVTCTLFTMVYTYMNIDERIPARGKTLESFDQAMKLTKTALKPSNPQYLRVTLDFAKFHQKCLGNTDEAVKLLVETLNVSLKNITDKEIPPESLQLIQLIKETVTGLVESPEESEDDN